MSRIIFLAACLELTGSSVFADEAIDLFSGNSFDLWTAQNGKPVPAGWQINDGLVHFDPARGKGGNIVTAADYGDFELSFDFKIGEKGNSGIKYRVQKYGKRVLGLEYQILDDSRFTNQKPTHLTASLYDIREPAGAALQPDEFNTGRIVVRGNVIQHWLNGQLVVTQSVGSDD